MDPEPTIAHAKKLMIVDDDVEMRTLLAEYFRRLGFEVAEKENAALALQAVRPIASIVSSWMWPCRRCPELNC